jgi:glycosyltransferase involved in cell wall biosynthesis
MAIASPDMVSSSVRHIVHLSYAKGRLTSASPQKWLDRVAFVTGVPEKLLEYGPQTVIYNIDYKGEVRRHGVTYLFPRFRRWQLVLPFRFNKFIKRLKPDVILIHGLVFPWQIIMLRNILGPSVKFICQHHSERPFKDLRKHLAKRADRYIGGYLFASKEQGNEWVRAGQISSIEKVHEVIGMASIFHSDSSKRDSRTYLWIGDLDKNKDPLLVARAFRKFSEGKDVRLYMIYQERQLEKELKKIVTPSIQLVGTVEHAKLQAWFNKASYIISTSHYEGIGIAVLEAMSCGCFPIVTNIPSFRTMTAGGTLGRLFEPGDEIGLITALEQTFDISRSDEVIAHYEAELSFEANGRKIMNVINNL